MSGRRRRWDRGLRLSPERRRLLLGTLAVVLVAFGVGYAVTALFFMEGAEADAIATVPDVRGLPLEGAERAITGAGLALERGDSLANPRVPLGHVIAQTPLPGQEVAPGSAVRVLPSAGPVRRAVPDVSRLRAELAERALRSAGFEVVLQEDTSMVPAGRVIELDPPIGTELQLPARVRLRVSLGPPAVEVPRLVGLELEVARDSLRARGLHADVEYGLYWRSRAGEVLMQAPLAGDSLLAGDTVRLTVSTGRVRRFRRDFRPLQ